MIPVATAKVEIPAAGLGTRFLPVTKASPKELLPLIDTPLIQYNLEEAVQSGLTAEAPEESLLRCSSATCQ